MYVVAFADFLLFALGALMTLISLFIKDAKTMLFLEITMYLGLASLILFGFYYIVKAACIYIQKEESE